MKIFIENHHINFCTLYNLLFTNYINIIHINELLLIHSDYIKIIANIKMKSKTISCIINNLFFYDLCSQKIFYSMLFFYHLLHFFHEKIKIFAYFLSKNSHRRRQFYAIAARKIANEYESD